MKKVVIFAALAAMAGVTGNALAQDSAGLFRLALPKCQAKATVVVVVQANGKVSYDCAVAGQDVSRTVTGSPIRRIAVRVSGDDQDGCTLFVKLPSGRERAVDRIRKGEFDRSIFRIGQKIMTFRLDC